MKVFFVIAILMVGINSLNARVSKVIQDTNGVDYGSNFIDSGNLFEIVKNALMIDQYAKAGYRKNLPEIQTIVTNLNTLSENETNITAIKNFITTNKLDGALKDYAPTAYANIFGETAPVNPTVAIDCNPISNNLAELKLALFKLYMGWYTDGNGTYTCTIFSGGTPTGGASKQRMTEINTENLQSINYLFDQVKNETRYNQQDLVDYINTNSKAKGTWKNQSGFKGAIEYSIIESPNCPSQNFQTFAQQQLGITK